MRLTVLLLTLMVAIAFVGSAMAVPPGKTVDYAGEPMGKVVFDGKIHMDKGLKCNDCHTKIFQMKSGTVKLKMADLNAGKYCGTCHNGDKAFKTSDPKSCMKCHKKN
jgi:c(7)-type cytochrome triheme protein